MKKNDVNARADTQTAVPSGTITLLVLALTIIQYFVALLRISRYPLFLFSLHESPAAQDIRYAHELHCVDDCAASRVFLTSNGTTHSIRRASDFSFLPSVAIHGVRCE